MRRRRKHRAKPKPRQNNDDIRAGVQALLDGLGIIMERLDEIESGAKGPAVTLEERRGELEIPPGRLAANGSSLDAATNVSLWKPLGFDGRYL